MIDIKQAITARSELNFYRDEIYKKLEIEKKILKCGEFSVYCFPKKQEEKSFVISNYLIISTFPPLVEKPSKLFSHYGHNYKKKLEEIFDKNEFDVFIVEPNEIRKIKSKDEILKLVNRFDNSEIYC